jgi:YesN/AraC family two-component response regulator
MERVLVVEDEKLIRQGIATMIKRCGVPVGEVLECANGLQALDILKEKEIDVMFTDIRMPKMNGMELVDAMQDLDRVPLTIAVSGYDDFSYAVEMMRHGVREYILKPVERDKLRQVMEKMEEEIARKKDVEQKTEHLGRKLITYILTDKDESDDNLKMLDQRIKSDVGDEFRVLICARDDEIESDISGSVSLSEIDGCDVFILGKEKFDEIFSKYRDEEKGFISTAGISDGYTDAVDLKKAYRQAKKRKETAFFTESLICRDEDIIKVPEMLLENGKKLSEKQAVSARVQLIGTDRTETLEKEWNGFFIAAERCQIDSDDFGNAIATFFEEFERVYRHELPANLSRPFSFASLTDFKEQFLEMVFEENSSFMERASEDQTEKKMATAVKYIRENYASDLNMAVVSNEVSMNYSLFSSAFKNYTGTNFVSYVKELRMNEAKRLLSETDLRVNEIALKVGYDNDKHFMKTFKAVVGVSPSEYRKNTTELGNNR